MLTERWWGPVQSWELCSAPGDHLMAMQWRCPLGELKDWEAEPLACSPVLMNLTALSALAWRLLHSYHWLHQFAWFSSNLKLFTCLFWKMKTPCYLNWKGRKKKQDKPCSLKALLNPINGSPAILSLGFMLQWITSLFQRASIHGAKQSLFHADCVGIF